MVPDEDVVMTRIREWINRNPRIVLIVAAGVIAAVVVGYMWVQRSQTARQAASPAASAPAASPASPQSPTATAAPPAGSPATGASGAAGTQPATGTAQTGAPGSGAQSTQSAAQSGAAAPAPTGGNSGRDPFSPLVQPGSGQGGGGAAPLPPVPTAVPGGGVPLPPLPNAQPQAPPPPPYHLTGVVAGQGATPLAILADTQGTYIVGPGELLPDGTRVNAVSVVRSEVELEKEGTRTTLALLAPVAPAKP